ncbi:MAG: transketolase C-terminal domain-containing protein [Steroidobacteraceae bacterium]
MQITFLEAIKQAQAEEMRRDPRVIVLGEDVEADLFGTTSGIAAEFGPERLRNTPISEAAITGVAAGAAMVGLRPIVDFTIAPFMYPAMDQIVSIISKSRYLYGGQASVPLVLRANMLYRNSAAAQHSDRPYSLFMHIPGLKIIVPSNPYDMKGLLKSAIRDEDPVLCFEDGNLWTSRADVPDGELLIPLGRAAVKRDGSDVSIVAIGGMVPIALQAADDLERERISVEVIDPRSLAPLDLETIFASVHKTGRLVVVDVSHQTCSAASEIAAAVASEAFWDLCGPIVRVTTPMTHIPFSPPLEKDLYPNKDKVIAAVRKTLA